MLWAPGIFKTLHLELHWLVYWKWELSGWPHQWGVYWFSSGWKRPTSPCLLYLSKGPDIYPRGRVGAGTQIANSCYSSKSFDTKDRSQRPCGKLAAICVCVCVCVCGIYVTNLCSVDQGRNAYPHVWVCVLWLKVFEFLRVNWFSQLNATHPARGWACIVTNCRVLTVLGGEGSWWWKPSHDEMVNSVFPKPGRVKDN